MSSGKDERQVVITVLESPPGAASLARALAADLARKLLERQAGS